MCYTYGKNPLPFTVTSVMAYALWYVCVRRNSSANLNSEVARLHAYARTQRPRWPWPDFTADGGDSLTSRLGKIQKTYPAEVRGAPALTLRAGLRQVIAYLDTLGPANLWALQWKAILSLKHSAILRPSEIIPLDKFPVASGTTSGFAYPRVGEFSFVSPDPPAGCAGGAQYTVALSKCQKDCFDARLCTVAVVNQLPGAVVDAARDLLAYMRAAGVLGARPDTPVFYYRNRDGSLRGHMSRAMLLREFRQHILVPAGVPEPFSFTLRSLRPGGATDFAAAGVPDSVVRKIGKWSSEHGMVPYNRVDHHLLLSLSQHRVALLAIQ
jgi:integrase